VRKFDDSGFIRPTSNTTLRSIPKECSDCIGVMSIRIMRVLYRFGSFIVERLSDAFAHLSLRSHEINEMMLMLRKMP
jgi:hypothetical protein